MEWSEVKSNQLKKLSAAIGTGAVVAMGALAVAVSGQGAPTETVISDPEMTLGETAHFDDGPGRDRDAGSGSRRSRPSSPTGSDRNGWRP